MGGHQLLVGGDDVLPGQQGPAGEVQGDLGAADGFYHHIQIGVILQNCKILYRNVPVGGSG